MIRAVLQDLASGRIAPCDVPEPELRPGGVLVRTAFSAISSGTECAKVEAAEKNLLGKALARPDLVKQVVDFARSNGIRAAYNKVKSRLDTLAPMGYSCSGTVIGVGHGVTDFRVGDRVACAGGGYANHAEVNWIPSNLAVRVPDGIALEAASLTTIGAIAMQGLRQADLKFGESVVVIGAGLVGVLTVAIARAAGCRVIAVDLDESRVAKASTFGAQLAMLASDPRLNAAVHEFSRYGVDAAIVTAASRSAEPLELAARLLRDRGRIVVVGDVGMGVSRPNMYHKELAVLMSRSYGPGRYDRDYEEGGQDYPIGYVRWTERRNMEAFLDLVASGAVDLAPLLDRRFPIEDGELAYADLRSGSTYTAILQYPADRVSTTLVPSVNTPQAVSGVLRIGCIGAGSFACAHIFPNLCKATGIRLHSVATASGVTAESARRNFGFASTETPSELLSGSHVDVVFIASHHQSHAEYVSNALKYGKAVFVEKPLATTRAQLELVQEAYLRSSEKAAPFLMVGFNRRFAPATQRIRKFFAGRREPMVVHIRINAGFLPKEHWTQQPSEGGRIIGELCHFLDWSRYVVGSPIRTTTAAALSDGSRYSRDNVAVVLTFADGSIANLLYLSNGARAVPKEYYEVFCEGSVARLDDFRVLELARGGTSEKIKCKKDKGHKAEIQETLDALRRGKASPIPFEELMEVTETSFSVVDAINSSTSIHPTPTAADSTPTFVVA
jgi:predicted dehydrogenase/threonine dehydrogenase-like Zn-dependent dehydrogenase